MWWYSVNISFKPVWESESAPGIPAGTPVGREILAQRYDNTGAKKGTEFHVNRHFDGDQVDPKVAMSSPGTFVISWEDKGLPGTGNDTSVSSAQARVFSSFGTPLSLQFQLNSYTYLGQTRVRLAIDDSDQFVAVWDGPTSAGDDFGITARRFEVMVTTTITTTSTTTTTSSTTTTIPPTVCTALPATGCTGSSVLGKSVLLVKDSIKDSKDVVKWVANKVDQTLLGEFGDPVTRVPLIHFCL